MFLLTLRLISVVQMIENDRIFDFNFYDRFFDHILANNYHSGIPNHANKQNKETTR